MRQVRLILAVAVALAMIVPLIGNSIRGQMLSDATAASVATLLGAIVTGLFFLKKKEDEDEEDGDDDEKHEQ